MPSLHISLGVYKRLFDLLEEDCNALDNTIFHHQVTDEDIDEEEDDFQSNNFTQNILSARADISKLKESLEKKQAQLEELKDDLPLQLLKLSSQELEQEAEFHDDDDLQELVIQQHCLTEEIKQLVSDNIQ